MVFGSSLAGRKEPKRGTGTGDPRGTSAVRSYHTVSNPIEDRITGNWSPGVVLLELRASCRSSDATHTTYWIRRKAKSRWSIQSGEKGTFHSPDCTFLSRNRITQRSEAWVKRASPLRDQPSSP
eukprot:4486822-Prymnesium_polylepis.2